MTDTPNAAPPADENQIFAERRAKLAKLREAGPAFPNDFNRTHRAGDLQSGYEQASREELAGKNSSSTSPTMTSAAQRTRRSSSGTWATSSPPAAR